MQEVIQVVYFIKTRALNSWLFAKMCSEFWSEHIHLLYHSEIRRLSREKVLQRLLKLRTETEVFLAKKCFWLKRFWFNIPMFAEINSLNISMQGCYQTLVDFSRN